MPKLVAWATTEKEVRERLSNPCKFPDVDNMTVNDLLAEIERDLGVAIRYDVPKYVSIAGPDFKPTTLGERKVVGFGSTKGMSAAQLLGYVLEGSAKS